MSVPYRARIARYRQNLGSAARFFKHLWAEKGLKEAVRATMLRALQKSSGAGVPLERADPRTLFAVHTDDIRAMEKHQMRASALVVDASKIETTYPLVFEAGERFMRYAWLPASGESRGMVVLFHGHNGFLHLGPISRWKNFDVLAPWDTFGWHRQGSWFWGERGDNFVEKIVAALIEKYRAARPDQPWFTLGSSMGGFAALYHGITRECHGIYAMAPQVDLRFKIVEYGKDNRDTAYGYLQGDTLDSVPDLYALAESREILPPLFLIQNQ